MKKLNLMPDFSRYSTRKPVRISRNPVQSPLKRISIGVISNSVRHFIVLCEHCHHRHVMPLLTCSCSSSSSLPSLPDFIASTGCFIRTNLSICRPSRRLISTGIASPIRGIQIPFLRCLSVKSHNIHTWYTPCKKRQRGV